MKKKAIGILAGIAAVALAATACAACGGGDTPEAAAGVIYQTDVVSFWVGVGHAYMTFEEVAEDSGEELTGYVFKVNVNSGDGYDTWLYGSWDLSSDETTLTLNATWEDGDTALTDATSGEDKTYTASSRKFTIPVDLPSASNTKFTLDLDNDKVGDGIEKTPSTDDSSSNNDDSTGTETTVATALEATSGDMTAYLNLYSDNTWDISISYYSGMAAITSVSGTWAMDTTTFAITLTVTSDVGSMCSEDTYTLSVDYSTYQYSGTISLSIQGTSTEFEFAPAAEESSAEVQATLTATSGTYAAMIELYDDNTWDLSIQYYSEGGYVKSVSGTWAFKDTATYDYTMVLTVTSDAGSMCSATSYELTVSSTTYKYSGTISLSVVGSTTEFSFTQVDTTATD